MSRPHSVARASCLLLTFILIFPALAYAIEPQTDQAPVTVQGTVVSITRTTMVIKDPTGEYKLFELNSATTRPSSIPLGSTVSVTFMDGARTGKTEAPVAANVRVTALPAQPPAAPGAKVQPPVPAPTADPVPASVHQMESSIKRQTRKYHIGVHGGLALDPEMVVFGATSVLGPVFGEHSYVRGGLEFGFGELTTLLGVNVEGLYRQARTESRNKSLYFGMGLAFNFSRRSFETDVECDEATQDCENDRLNFSDLNYDVGLSLFGGIQYKNGFYLEFKTTAYSIPSLQFHGGFTF